jgi:ribonuclease Y
MESFMVILISAMVGGVFFLLGWLMNAKTGHNKIASAKEMAKRILDDAAKEADTVKREKLLEVKDEWYSKKKEFDGDVQSKRSKLVAQEKALDVREENIDRKV